MKKAVRAKQKPDGNVNLPSKVKAKIARCDKALGHFQQLAFEIEADLGVEMIRSDDGWSLSMAIDQNPTFTAADIEKMALWYLQKASRKAKP